MSAARSALISRSATWVRITAAAASIRAGSAPAPSPPRAVSATSASPACSQCRRYASTVTVNPLGRFTPARNSSASLPILAPQMAIAWSGAMSSTQAMAPAGVTGSDMRSACPVRCLLNDGHPAGAAVDLDLVPVGDDHRGQAGRGDGGDAVLAADDGGVREGAAAVADTGGDLGERRGPVGRGGLAHQHVARVELVQFVGVVQDAGPAPAGALGG